MDAAAKNRANECKDKVIEKAAYEKFKNIINSMTDNEINQNKLKEAAKIFFNLAENNSWNDREQFYTQIPYDQKKALVLEISGEAINRDMIDYIIKGKRGKLGSQMYNVLK